MLFTENHDNTTSPHTTIGLTQNIIKILLGKYPEKMGDLYISASNYMTSMWRSLEQNVSVRGELGLLLASKTPWHRFFDSEIVKNSVHHTFDEEKVANMFSDWTSTTVKHRSTPYVSTLFPYCHTFIISARPQEFINPYIPTKPEEFEHQAVQKCFLFLHGHLVNQAVTKYGNDIMGRELPEPQCGQGIMTFGKRFYLMWYQLNTLNMRDHNYGVKNLLAQADYLTLYDDILERKDRPNYKIPRINEESLKMLISMFLW